MVCLITSDKSLSENAYRIIEVDGSDVILRQSNATILRVDEQESLREENDFPYKI